MPEAQEWTGNEALDPNRFADDEDGRKRFNARNHPNMKDPGDFKEWMVTSPNSMVDQFAVGATVEDTVTPANPTPPTNIQYWGETPPNSPEMITAFTPEQDTYIAEDDPRRSELEDGVKEAEEARYARVKEFNGNYEEAEGVFTAAGEQVTKLVYEDQTKFAPNLGGMPHEAAGTEEVITTDIESGEDTVTIPVTVSAGVVGYTRIPNATHPSNENPQEVLPPDQGGGGGGTEPTLDLTDIDPDSAVVGAPFTLTVTGTGFTSNSVVLLDDAPLPTTFVSDTQLTADATAGAAPATVDVEVQDGEVLSDALTFDYVAAAREGGERSERQKRKTQRKPSRKPASKEDKTKTKKKGRR